MQLRSHSSPLPMHKPLLLLHICLLYISSQIKCYSLQSLETPRAAEKHMRSSHARWSSPGMGAAPQAEHVTVRTETEGNPHMWTGCTQDGTQPTAQLTPSWCLIQHKHFHLEQDKVQPLQLTQKKLKITLMVNENNDWQGIY